MNEDKWKIRTNKKGEMKRLGGWHSDWIKPSGKFWKRYFKR